MKTITNAKIESITPVWADFRGFSLLFDNPGDALESKNGTVNIACQSRTNPEQRLYHALESGLASLDLRVLASSHGFLALPPDSYHVTVWDGVNRANLRDVVPALLDSMTKFLVGIPSSLTDPPPAVAAILDSRLTTERFGPIRLKFGGLSIRGHQSLIARLVPLDKKSGAGLSSLQEARNELDSEALSHLGIRSCCDYDPHVSLGYFVNDEGGISAESNLGEWENILRSETRGIDIMFDMIGFYGFTDMAHFFKGPRSFGSHA